MINGTVVTPDIPGLPKVANEPPKEMLSVEREGSRTKVRINYSSLNIIQGCARKSRYALYEKWKSKAPAPALIYGQAVHKALETFYSYSGKERELPENFLEHALLMTSGYDAPETHFMYEAVAEFVSKGKALEVLPDDDIHSLKNGVWVLVNYFETYLHDHYVIHRDEKGPVVERGFEVPLWSDNKLDITLFGQIDFVLRNEATDEILPGDHKTASRLSGDFLNRIKPNHQYTGYLLGAHKTLNCSGENFLVNGIEKKARPKTARGGPPKFIRQITSRSPHDFVEFHFAVRDAVENYLKWYEKDVWPIGSVDTCAMWGSCTYLDVCSAPNELRQNILEAKFQRG